MYVPSTLRDYKKDKFMVLEHVSMYVAAYEAKFHDLSCYAKQLLNTEHDRIRLFIRGLDFELRVLCVLMNFEG